ncbi:GcrA family cell cycle regulator [Brevundimonas mediterranea]|uniref:GcrA family cell cycle regulator n=1 Tax=Brevundimonas mediterranea TaxID=74329 RepID=UPI004033A062
MTASAWTEDRINRMKTLWLEGQTADQIARDLANGISRSAVLGKVHRMGLSAGRSGRPPKRPVVSRDPPQRAPARSIAVQTIDTTPEVATERGLATVLSVRRCECRWPFGEPEAADSRASSSQPRECTMLTLFSTPSPDRLRPNRPIQILATGLVAVSLFAMARQHPATTRASEPTSCSNPFSAGWKPIWS